MRTTLILITAILFTSLSFSQGGVAYKDYKKLDDGLSQVCDMGKIASYENEAKKLANERAKKFFKLSKKHGNIDAELFLDKNL